jgi:16S rRNA (uracil1498-N3)-methyltransferase
MTTPRFFVPTPLAVDSEVELPESSAHHALRVLRLAAGDAVTLFNGQGGEYAGVLAQADRRAARVRITDFLPVERESPLAVTLVQGLTANDTMDFIVRKAVELGAVAIRPVLTERSARHPAGERGERRLAHWRQIAQAACEQCGRNRVPAVHPVVALAEVGQTMMEAGQALTEGADKSVDKTVGKAAEKSASVAPILLAPEAKSSLAELPPPGVAMTQAVPLAVTLAVTLAITLGVGPEGGFTADEVARAARAGWQPARLGPRVLRAETAAVAALAAVNVLWGDWR